MHGGMEPGTGAAAAVAVREAADRGQEIIGEESGQAIIGVGRDRSGGRPVTALRAMVLVPAAGGF